MFSILSSCFTMSLRLINIYIFHFQRVQHRYFFFETICYPSPQVYLPSRAALVFAKCD